MDRDMDAGHTQHANYQPHIHAFDSNPSSSPRRDRPDPILSRPAAASHPYASAFNSSSSPLDPRHYDDAVNPDDFYKSFDVLPAGDPDTDSMASTPAPRPAIRPNANLVSPRRPDIPSTRSVSSPVDPKLPARSTPTGRSVRDMAKRFDRVDVNAPTARQQYSNVRNGKAESGPERSTYSSRATRTQRPKAVAEDHVANNSQSFASRVGKPRNAAVPDAHGPKSAARQPVRAPTNQRAPVPPPASQPLLFGEILPDQRDASALGFGITNIRSHQAQSGSHSRSFSDSNLEPPSPSGWYREENLESRAVVPSHEKPGKTHGRSQSHNEFAGYFQDVLPVPSEAPSLPSPTASPNTNSVPVSSKLPLPVKTLGNPVNSSSTPSTPSTRPNSPSTATGSSSRKKPTGNAAASARTKPPVTRSNTPTQSAGGRRGGLPRPVTPSSNSGPRLKAYIASPPPKLSPGLRSSRPRQPVSEATTASSRIRTADRAKSPSAAYARAAAKSSEPVKRQRKVSLGPIDFAQRREHIKLAYSKSVRESQALAARKSAAEKRKKELAAAAEAKISAEAVALASALPPGTTDFPDFGPPSTSEECTPIDEPRQYLAESSPEDASLVPDAKTASASVNDHNNQVPIESPTLGVPGSFPMLSPPLEFGQRPQSTASVRSETTEFDNEPQVAMPGQAETPTSVPFTLVAPPTPRDFVSSHERAEYHYPFVDEPDSPVETSPTINAMDQLGGHLPAEYFRSHEDTVDNRTPGAFVDGIEDATGTPGANNLTRSLAHPPAPDYSKSKPAETIPFPRIEPFDDSDECHSEEEEGQPLGIQSGYLHDAKDTDACSQGSDGDDKRTNCGADSAQGDSGGDESDVDSPHPAQHGGLGLQHTSSISNGLEVPTHAASTDRFSQQSTWTDLSVGSSGRAEQHHPPALHDTPREMDTEGDGDESPVYGHATIFEPSPRLQYDSGNFSDHQFSGDVQRPYNSARSSAVLSQYQHRSPDLNNGQPASLSFTSDAMSHNLSQETNTSSPYYVPRPVHDPPPIPTSAPGSAYASRRTSAIIDSPQRGSTLSTSTRPNDDFVNILETPQTNGSGSPAMSDGYFPSHQATSSTERSLHKSAESNMSTDKERHRLVQRRNVIKELIDTEMVFVRDMNVIEEIYKGTAEACPRLDDQTVKIVFRNTIDIIEFHTGFLANLKAAVSDVYVPKGGRSPVPGSRPESEIKAEQEPNDACDRMTSIGQAFQANIEGMKAAHESFLRTSDQAARKLIEIQQDPGVKLWLNECNEVAKDLTAAWDLDSLLIKPMQRITKYPNIIITLLQHTPQDHPDREPLTQAKDVLETAIIDINTTKKNFELVGQIVGRKRKESDVRAGFARAFGKRGDKVQGSAKPTEDIVYTKLNEKFGDDYLRLQVVLRDVEFYTRQVSAYVHEFLQYLSSVELVMRLQPGSYPELESKWVQFNISVRDLEKNALVDHLAQVRRHVIEPFEQVIKAYGNPSLAMKKRQKRRADYERAEQLRRSGKPLESKLAENVEQYEALNDTLKKELPKLSALTEKVGNLCLANFVNIQVKWYGLWRDKMKSVLADCPDIPDVKAIVATFQREFPYAQEQVDNIPMLNPATKTRISQSTTRSTDEASQKSRRRPAELEMRSRGVSVNGDYAPSLPTPDFGKVASGSSSLVMTPGAPLSNATSPHQYFYRDHYAGLHLSQNTIGTTSSQEASERMPRSTGGPVAGPVSTRPSTGRSYESGQFARQSSESSCLQQQDSNTSVYSSNHNLPQDGSRYSGLFKSAMPMSDQPDDSQRVSRASSRERLPADGYNVLWLAASLFEFNINTTKHEAGYPYLVYQAGEIFDVIAEKGELWLAKNQDDPNERVGWIWSKHFAKLADS